MTANIENIVGAAARSGWILKDEGKGVWSLERYMPSGQPIKFFLNEKKGPLDKQIQEVCKAFKTKDKAKEEFPKDDPTYILETFKELSNAVSYASKTPLLRKKAKPKTAEKPKKKIAIKKPAVKKATPKKK